jgi:4-amino-4-deoxy-L-arabinose transferase-like glycosyltransferase
MAEIRRFGPMDFLFLVLIFAVAGGARAFYLMRHADNGRVAGPLAVQDPRPDEIASLTENIRSGKGFTSPAPFSPGEETTAHTSPGYPYLIGLFGGYIGESRDFYLRWFQVGLGAFTAAFYYLFARRAFRSLAVGIVAGLATALNPFWIINVAEIDDGTFTSFALALCLLLGGQAGEKGGALKSLLFGVSLAALALLRAALLPFSFVTLLWFLLRSGSLNRGWLCAVCAFLGFANGLAPWAVRNYQVYGEPIPVVSSAYYHLWVGNNPAATGGPVGDDMRAKVVASDLEKLPQPERYSQLGKGIFAEVKDEPVKTLRRRVQATFAFVFGQQWVAGGSMAQATPSEDATEIPVDTTVVLLGSVLAVLALAFLGWRWSYGWRWESIPATLAMIWIPLPYILGHAESLSGPRLPLDGVLSCFAAFALCCLVPGINGTLFDPPVAEPTPSTGADRLPTR